MEDIDAFVFSSGGREPPEGYTGGLDLLGASRARFISVDHHLSHAVGAFCLSPFDKALVVVLDALGNKNATESYYVGDHGRIEYIGGNDRTRPRCQGIGATYEAFTNLLGYIDQESGKVMALAAYGDAARFAAPLFAVRDTQVASGLQQTHQWGAIDFVTRHGFGKVDLYPDSRSEIARDLAAYVQRELEVAAIHLVGNLVRTTGIRKVCLSGGVALNCVMNTKIREALNLEGLFILPSASDTGQALGNALYGYCRLTGELPRYPLTNAFLGKSYSETHIEVALRRESGTTPFGRLLRFQHAYHRESDVARVAAQLVAEGSSVAWFQGGSELGPRALGHRSILADPRSEQVRDLLNSRVKHREWFRPFAPSVLADRSGSYFHLEGESRFMLEAPLVRPEHRAKVPAVVHVDGTSRVQTIDEGFDPVFRKVISEFDAMTGIPMILNTSFNDREPIVETPGDALFTFLSGELDYLVIGDYLVEKRLI